MSTTESNGTIIGHVKELWRYPVKSMLGESCTELEFDDRGAIGDRFYAVRRNDGKLGSGKDSDRFCEMLGLFEFQARLTSGEPVVTFPDGAEWRASDTKIHAALSKVFGTEVTLSPEGDVAHMDAGSVHLVTSHGLHWLSSESGSAECDPRRFRANILIEFGTDGSGDGPLDGSASGPVELDWIGDELRIGADLCLNIVQATGRCVMTTFAQSELPRNARPLRTLNRATGGQFGVYGLVDGPGTVLVGDTVRLRAR